MKKASVESVVVETGTWKRILKCEGEPVLTLSMRWPKLPEDRAAFRRIGRFYQYAADRWRARWEGPLFQDACKDLAEARAKSFPFHPYEAALDFHVTYNEKCLLSITMDAYEYTGGAHGNTVRCGDTWSLGSGMPRTLASFFPPKSHWRREVVAEVRKQIAARIATGEYEFLDGWEKEAARQLDPCRFYLNAQGVAVFYPLYTLAPYVEGIVSFVVLPWAEG